MYPLFTYPELQNKFCEGFEFIPFAALVQHSGFIYKCYKDAGNIPGILDRYSCLCNFNSINARVLSQKLKQKDIFVAVELLHKLDVTGNCLEKRFYSMRRRPAIYEQLLKAMHTFHGILTVYRQQVLLHIAGQLSATTEAGCNIMYEEVTEDNLREIGRMVQEFLRSADIMDVFLESCLRKLPGFRKLILLPEERESLQNILNTIAVFIDLQQKTIHVLDQWKLDMTLTNAQLTNN